MDAEQYAVAQAAISARLVRDVLPVAEQFRAPQLSYSAWIQFLQLILPFVTRARDRSAKLGRRFFDEQRAEHHPEIPRHDVFLAEYRLEWLLEAMEPARAEFSRPGASEHAAERIALRGMKETENAGRRTILRAVDTDSPGVAVGWARVATGRETCGFCMMLVSRGPVYKDSDGGPGTAGLNTDHDTAVELWNDIENARTPAERKKANDAMDEMMTKWHEGCDCKVVPVFDRANWPGRDAFKRAEVIWKNATKGFTGKDKMNAFRRAIERGDVDLIAMSIAA